MIRKKGNFPNPASSCTSNQSNPSVASCSSSSFVSNSTGVSHSRAHSSQLSEKENENESSSDQITDYQSQSNLEDVPKKKKRKIYLQRFKKEWVNIFPWLEARNTRAFCKACMKSIAVRVRFTKNTLKKEEKTAKLDNYVTKDNELLNAVKKAELGLTIFLHEHNLPFLLMDHLILLLSVICPDSKIAKQLKCARTKTTNLTHCIAEEQIDSISKKFQNQYYSLIVAETTDISNKKSLVIVARYFDTLQNKCRDSFIGLIRVLSADSEGLFNGICNYLKELNIPLNNLVGLAADNVSVMMGNISRVQARFRAILPNIFVMGCVCHSFNLCSSAAAKKLPRSLENFIRQIYSYFSHSSKRIEKLQEFQKFMDLKPHQMLHPAQTRWLSLQAAVDRVLENWDALRLFCQGEYLEENLHNTKHIMDSLENPIYKIYFTFLSYILDQVNRLNLEFQSEKPKLHLLLKRSSDLYRSILRNYITQEVVIGQTLNNINPSNPRIFLPLEKVYFGANVEVLIKTYCDRNPQGSIEIKNFKICALDFYIELAQQIKKRFKFDEYSKYCSRSPTIFSQLNIKQRY
ncbi:hypothetical protein NQ315_014786 [Exocentrus adspersus]|uniref:DUF4371 domain-containing protein n=1 Tax=Exocentrus adspersus TaxID=1586481 RepID=A0AAV8VM41_9CUCU|nr:hypothetical protein NQ315_014786 [Exocentrus adspersus]